MCFSFEISIASFLFSWGTSLYLMQQNLTKYQFNSLVFLMIFSSMQLADALLWWDGMRKTPLNFVVTSYLVPFVLSLQLLFIPVYLMRNKYPAYTAIVLIGCVFLFYRLHGYSRSIDHVHLSSPEWANPAISFTEAILFAIAIFWHDPIFLFIALAIISTAKLLVGGAIGSLWCAVSTLVSLYYLVNY